MKCKEKCKKVEWRFQNFISINKVYDDVGFHKPFSPSYYTIAIWDSNRSNLFRGSMVKRRNCKVLIFRGLIQETSWLNGLPVIQGCPATKLHLDWNAFTVKRNFTFVSCSLAPSQRVIIFAFQPTSTSSIRLWSNNLRFKTEDCFHSFHVQQIYTPATRTVAFTMIDQVVEISSFVAGNCASETLTMKQRKIWTSTQRFNDKISTIDIKINEMKWKRNTSFCSILRKII